MMMTVMLAVSRGSGSGGARGVRIGVRAASGLADSARVMTVMMLIKVGGGEAWAAAGPTNRTRFMVAVMLIKSRDGGENRRALIKNRDGGGTRVALKTRGGGETRAAGGSTDRVRVMMVMMLFKSRGGGETRAAGGLADHACFVMVT
jgi:hypothetical protein